MAAFEMSNFYLYRVVPNLPDMPVNILYKYVYKKVRCAIMSA